MGNRLARIALAIGGSIALVLSTASVANAATPRNGVCEAGEFCLYYLQNRTGSVSDFNSSISSYGSTLPTCYVFKGPGAGQGTCVRNNAVSAWNRMTGHTVFVYNSASYVGTPQIFGVGQYGNLNSYNDNESHKLITN